jgi:hypothetical protein
VGDEEIRGYIEKLKANAKFKAKSTALAAFVANRIFKYYNIPGDNIDAKKESVRTVVVGEWLADGSITELKGSEGFGNINNSFLDGANPGLFYNLIDGALEKLQ